VSEENDGAESGVEGASAGADPVAVALALGGAGRDRADSFLKKQEALIEDQRLHLHEQLKQLHIGIWEKWLGVLLRVATACVGFAVAAGLALMVWDAAHSKGLLIEPFSVPPDMAARGLTGQVVAAQLLDRLAVMSSSESSRSTQSYANNWGDDIKVEIPETGVSISELERFLRGWLGHDTRISGEVYRTATGIAVTTRAGANGATFAGADGDLDALVQKGAEHVFESTQPYRYANYLDRNYNPVGLPDRVARATAIYKKLIAGDDPFERAWAWNGLGTIAFRYHKDDREAIADYSNAIASSPDFTIAWFARAFREVELSHDENTLAGFRTAGRLLHRDSIPDLNPNYIPYARLSADTFIHYYVGDFAGVFPIARTAAELNDDFSVLARSSFQNWALESLGRLHDAQGVQSYLRHLGPGAAVTDPFSLVPLHAQMQDWQGVRALESAARRDAFAYSRGIRSAGNFGLLRPYLALARAHLGDFAGAEALIAPAAGDNDDAVRARAQIAEMEGNHARADWWFARSERQTPSIPFTDTLWGAALLGRGQPDAAIEKFTLANRKGPHFADPLEDWGEALMAKNQSHLALAKFEEANKYAPNWSRLHLKWGEALGYAGKPQDAKAQFARAATLGLTPSEKSELARVTHG
jgi:tetratricopeptide (TPR) repeat protein